MLPKIGENDNIYVKCFNSANIKDMHSYAKPIIERKRNLILLHICTYDLAQRRNEAEKSAVQVAHEIIELTNEMRVNDTDVAISSLVLRGDDFETKRKRVNLILADLCSARYESNVNSVMISPCHLWRTYVWKSSQREPFLSSFWSGIAPYRHF